MPTEEVEAAELLEKIIRDSNDAATKRRFIESLATAGVKTTNVETVDSNIGKKETENDINHSMFQIIN